MKTLSAICALLLSASAGVHAQGAIKATMRILPDGSTRTTVMNPDTRTTEETISEANGKVIRKTIFTMNEQNAATGATHVDAKGAVRYKEVYSLDYNGRITESKLYSRDDRPLGRRVFTYDAQNRAQVQDYDASGNLVSGRVTKTGTSREKKTKPGAQTR